MKSINIYSGNQQRVELEQLFQAQLPAYDPDGYFKPLPHSVMHQQTVTLIEELGHTITDSQFHMTDNHMRALGIYQFESQLDDDFNNAVTFFNSNDKSSATKMAAGKIQTVCLNSCITGEVVYKTQHTKHIMSRLPYLLGDAVTKIGQYVKHQEQMHIAYKRVTLDSENTDSQHQILVDHIIMEASRAKVIANTAIPNVEHQYWVPKHEEFTYDGYSLHRLHQAFTQNFQDKKYPYQRMARSSLDLQRIFNRIFAPQIQQVIDEMAILAERTN